MIGASLVGILTDVFLRRTKWTAGKIRKINTTIGKILMFLLLPLCDKNTLAININIVKVGQFGSVGRAYDL